MVRGDLSQEEFGARIGVSQSTVGYWEKNNVIPKERDRFKISEVFKVNLIWFLSGEGEPYMAGRKGVVTAVPDRDQAAEGEAPYRRQAERMNAAGELVDVTTFEPAESPIQAILKLIGLLEKKDRENDELRRKIEDLERRLAAPEEGASRREAEEKAGSGGGG